MLILAFIVCSIFFGNIITIIVVNVNTIYTVSVILIALSACLIRRYLFGCCRMDAALM